MSYSLRSHSQDRYPLRSFCPAYNSKLHKCSDACGRASRSRCSSVSSTCSVESRASSKPDRNARPTKKKPIKNSVPPSAEPEELLEVLDSPRIQHDSKKTQKDRKSSNAQHRLAIIGGQGHDEKAKSLSHPSPDHCKLPKPISRARTAEVEQKPTENLRRSIISTPTMQAMAPSRAQLKLEPTNNSSRAIVSKPTSKQAEAPPSANSTVARSVKSSNDNSMHPNSVCCPSSPTRIKPEPRPDPTPSSKTAIPKAEEPTISIFIGDGASVLDNYSRRLSHSQSIQMLHNIKQLVSSPHQKPCLKKLQPQLSKYSFYASGFSPASWYHRVEKDCPAILAYDTSYIKSLPLIDQNQLVNALCSGSVLNSLKLSSRYVVKFDRELNKPVKSSFQALAHIIVAALYHSETHTEGSPAGSKLNDYVEFKYFQVLFEDLKSVITSVVELKKPDPQLGKINLHPLALLFCVGISGIMLTKRSPLEFSPVAVAQFIHLFKLAADQGVKLAEEKVWINTHKWFFNQLHDVLTSDQEPRLPRISELADHIAADFMTIWAPTQHPVPWLYPRRAKGAPPPNICLKNILSHADF